MLSYYYSYRFFVLFSSSESSYFSTPLSRVALGKESSRESFFDLVALKDSHKVGGDKV